MKRIVHRVMRGIRRIVRRDAHRQAAPDSSAVLYNALEHVDRVNEDINHWLECRESDKRFIDAIYPDIIDLCGIDGNTVVADIGCGTGVLVSKLKTDFPDLHIVGYDFSGSKIRRCQDFYQIDPSCFSQGSVYDLDESRYDVIIATEVLEHLEYPVLAVRNLLSRLHPSGRLFLTVPDGRTDTYHGHIHFWSAESWALFVKEAVGPSGDIRTGMLKGKNFALVRVKG